MSQSINQPTFAVRYTCFKGDYLVTREKEFKTEAAMTRWLDRENNGVVQVLAFSA